MAIKAVLFDFWGTVVENGIFPSPVKQVKYILRVDMPFTEYITRFEKAFMTSKFDNLTDAFANVIKEFNLRSPRFVQDKLVGMWNKNTLLAKPFPDTIETLKKLREDGVKVGLICNTDQFSVDQVLDKFDLRNHFDAIVLSYNVGHLKGDAELFDKAIESIGIPKEDIIMVGDSIESDIKGADNAGVKSYLIDRKDTREFDNKIKSLDEIHDIVKG